MKHNIEHATEPPTRTLRRLTLPLVAALLLTPTVMAATLSGTLNSALLTDSVIAGGNSNNISSVTYYGAIAGGQSNTIGSSADHSFIGGGGSNTITNTAWYSALGGGRSNAILGTATFSAVAGGDDNEVGGNADHSFIGGGGLNGIFNTAWYSVLGGGQANTIRDTAQFAVVAGGQYNYAEQTGGHASVGGGKWNHATRPYSTIPGGQSAVTRSYGQMAYSSGGFVPVNGDAQTSTYVARGTTPSSTTPVTQRLYLDGVGSQIQVPYGASWAFEGRAVGASSTGQTGGWHIQGVIENKGGTTALVGTPTVTSLGSDVFSAPVTVQVVADDANDALVVQIVAGGMGAPAARWVASLETTELVY